MQINTPDLRIATHYPQVLESGFDIAHARPQFPIIMIDDPRLLVPFTNDPFPGHDQGAVQDLQHQPS
ncbi:hypothetical protein Hypma_001450 [Hypsizygus marmoreus]|uniref:Uncharacterized protein n=1 Tax=Hypsizygus marmoreus TaxID=39966 RepID=A0A369K0X1_HYPMA|nr:hypothetical protein Hypma_001450 [Hypsizygus marmoreus]